MQKIIMIFVLVMVLAGWSNVGYAQNNFLNTFTSIFQSNNAVTGNDLIDIMGSVGGYLLVAGGVLAGIVIVVAGIMWMTAGSNQQRVASAKAIFKNGVIGALIIFAFGLIINTIISIATNWQAFFS